MQIKEALGVCLFCCCWFWSFCTRPLIIRPYDWTTQMAAHYGHLIKKSKTKRLICVFITKDKHTISQSQRLCLLASPAVCVASVSWGSHSVTLGALNLNAVLLCWGTLIKGAANPLGCSRSRDWMCSWDGQQATQLPRSQSSWSTGKTHSSPPHFPEASTPVIF